MSEVSAAHQQVYEPRYQNMNVYFYYFHTNPVQSYNTSCCTISFVAAILTFPKLIMLFRLGCCLSHIKLFLIWEQLTIQWRIIISEEMASLHKNLNIAALHRWILTERNRWSPISCYLSWYIPPKLIILSLIELLNDTTSNSPWPNHIGYMSKQV